MRVGLDVGGTKTAAVAVDAAGQIRAQARLETGWGPEAVIRTIVDAVDALGLDGDIGTVGVGIPGQVDAGHVAHAVNLGIDGLDLAVALRRRLEVPVRVENDVKAAAIGAAARHGAGRAIAYLNLGTGVAAGIVADRELWRGANGAAGEIGHISIDPSGPDCRCGQRGCIEAFAGGGSIAQRWGRPGALPVRDVFDAADAGDEHARQLRAGLAFGVAAAVRVLLLTADADVVVLGGGLTLLGGRLLDDLRGELEASAAASAFLRSLRLSERVEVLPPGIPIAALGAALIGAGRD